MLGAFLIALVISMQFTQQVYVAEDWVRSATNSLNTESKISTMLRKHSAWQTTKKYNWLRSSRSQRMGEKARKLG